MSRDGRSLLVMEASGHVFRVERKRGPVWYAKYRLGDGRQIQRKIGPAWTERGRPPAGWFTRRGAEAWLRDVLDQARRGTLPGMVRTGATFADAAAEYLRYIEHDPNRKPTTLPGYRSIIHAHMLPAFGETALESITTPKIESWITTLDLAASTRTKTLRRHARHLRTGPAPLGPADQPGGRRRKATDTQTAAKSPSSHP